MSGEKKYCATQTGPLVQKKRAENELHNNFSHHSSACAAAQLKTGKKLIDAPELRKNAHKGNIRQ